MKTIIAAGVLISISVMAFAAKSGMDTYEVVGPSRQGGKCLIDMDFAHGKLGSISGCSFKDAEKR